MAADLTPALLRTLLHYEPDTGKLFWKPRPLDMFASERHGKIWNNRFAGKEALRQVSTLGYLQGKVLGKHMSAHRAAFTVYNGYWPIGEVDHKNGNKQDNRADNLRDVTRAQNIQNQAARRGSASRFIGVSWHEASGKWIAQAGGGRRHLGVFPCEKAAALAYDAAARARYGDCAKLNFPEGV